MGLKHHLTTILEFLGWVLHGLASYFFITGGLPAEKKKSNNQVSKSSQSQISI